MTPVEGERLDDALELFHDHGWVGRKPAIADCELGELLTVLRPWYEQELAPPKQRVSKPPLRPPQKRPSQARARRLVAERSEGLCEVCGIAAAREWHHRKNRSQGGLWEPANGLHLCRWDHQYITDGPMEAAENGWTVRSHEDPRSVPVLRRGQLVWLDNDGSFAVVEGRSA